MKELYVINHSGGKDSQAMFLLLSQNIPMDQIVVIHAHLPGVEWPGTIEHIKSTIGSAELHVVQAGKTFFQMVEHRGMWPSAQHRQCTSDLKRGPIEKKIREICNKRGFDKVINCMGLRAQESSDRAKKSTYERKESKCTRKRIWMEFLPIHSWTTDQVFNFIHQNGQEAHWAYAAGMSRLSCTFCIMASKKDLQTAARLNPELFEKYCEMEKKIDHTFMMPGKNKERKFLQQYISE